MTSDQLPPPAWPRRTWTPPAPWPPPDWPPQTAAEPRRRGRVLALVVSLGLIAVSVLALTGLAVLGGVRTFTDPTYPELTDAERAATNVTAVRTGASLDAWWGEQLSALGHPWQAVGERLTDGDDGVRCDGEPVVTDEDLLDNAWAAVCDEGPVVAYDPATFRLSDVALQVILAHEWGHIVQGVNVELDEIVDDPDADFAETELQADCFAGAWAAEHLSPEQRQRADEELRSIGDSPDVRSDDPDGHGSSDERSAAFLLGVAGGVTTCLPDAFDARPDGP